MLNAILTGCNDGLLWAILALGLYISFRVLDFADMTCEGTITLGTTVVTSLLTAWMSGEWFSTVVAGNLGLSALFWLLSILISTLAGTAAGVITGVLHTKLKVPPILSGILTMSALYTVNLWIMGGSSLDLPDSVELYTSLTIALRSAGIMVTKPAVLLMVNAPICLLLIGVLYWFFGTELGSAIRATGNNPQMCRAQGINTNMTTIIGLGIGNGLVAFSGALQAHYDSTASITKGVGAIVVGLAAIIVGEALFARFKNFSVTLAGIVVGSVLYRVIISAVILSFDPDVLKLVSAIIVVVALSLPKVIDYCKGLIKKLKKARQRTAAPAEPPAEAPAEAVAPDEGGVSNE